MAQKPHQTPDPHSTSSEIRHGPVGEKPGNTGQNGTGDDQDGGLTYAKAGVDIEAGNRLVKSITPFAKATARPGADAALGGFGALFDLKAAGYEDPILVSSTDGVGTKLKIAFATGNHGTVGIDLVAMCVNDLIVQGAEPLFFLDYFATGKLDTGVAAKVVEGIAEGCKQAGCALIGSETAEMPDMYAPNHYDLAGFAVGALERGRALPRPGIGSGDVLVALASSGLHSNGFSLVRRVLERAGLSYADPAPFAPDQCLGDALLTPTVIYRQGLVDEMQAGRIKAAAHITGGGVTENLPRVLPEGVVPEFDLGNVPRPAVFDWLQEEGGIADAEMARTFNCGTGMILVVGEADLAAVMDNPDLEAVSPRIIGRLKNRSD